jgi:O-antigen ligase
MVFMAHGLALARFLLVSTFFAFIVSRGKPRLLGMPSRVLGWGLFVVLILCKSTGAIVLAIAGLPVILWGKSKVRQTLAVVLAAVVLIYPVLRANDAFPVAEVLEAATGVEKERSESLAYRFANEDILLAKARERLLFGWGTYGRNQVYNEAGKAGSVTDGAWIVALGEQGIVGYVGMFGILLIPVFLARKRLRAIRNEDDRMLLSGVGFTLAVVVADLVPNGLFANFPYVIAGALMGVTRALVLERGRASAEMVAARQSAQ